MKILILLLAMISLRGHADSEAHCRLVEGIYTNSSTKIDEFRFETIVDVFTVRNANTFSIGIEDEHVRFTRSSMVVDRHTKMTFFQKKNSNVIRGAYVTLDRTPRQVAESRAFYGNIIISAPISNGEGSPEIIGSESLNYNFFCWF